MSHRTAACAAFGVVVLASIAPQAARAQGALEPSQPDANTLLLYHFDEGQGDVARDSSGHGYDGEVRGARWVEGRFGGALEFDGRGACVFREVTEAIRGLSELTVECWFDQSAQSGRRFLAGLDVGFHFEVDDGAYASLSIYNQGGGVPNAQGHPHQQISAPVGLIRPRWHHLAATYNGRQVSFFLDGVLRARLDAARDFRLGVASRGLWIGSYVGMDYWFSGRIDEVRVSDCVRYDPEGSLAVGDAAFEVPQSQRLMDTGRSVRPSVATGQAQLELTLRKRTSGDVEGWIYLKPEGRRASLAGAYSLAGLADGEERMVTADVSDEVDTDGGYVAVLESTTPGAAFSVLGATLTHDAELISEWTGALDSRQTFDPPILVPLRATGAAPAPAERIVLLSTEADRYGGQLELEEAEDGQAVLFGEGYAEWWVDVPQDTPYRVYLRYASGGNRPCDIVIDGVDLHPFNMCARNATGGMGLRGAIWEYQGSVRLAAGPHWIRIQDVLPDIAGLWLEPVDALPPLRVPWERFAVPAPAFLAADADWQPEGTMEAMGVVRNVRRGAWDLEPFGLVSLRYQGSGSGSTIALRLIDAKGDEKLLWVRRDDAPEAEDVIAPISFEGNDVFDPGHVVAVCVELHPPHGAPALPPVAQDAISGLTFARRDELVLPEGYGPWLAEARRALADLDAPGVSPWLSPGFRPWAGPVVPEEHPLFAETEPEPVTRATMGYDLHFTGARDISPAALADFHVRHDFGDVCWPHIGILPQRRDFATDADYGAALAHLEERLIAVRDLGLYLFDIWGYVPNDEAGPTPTVTPEHKDILVRVFGDRFLGFDNGEQDGRYIGAYADRGLHTDRREGWEDFVQWDEAICRDSQNYMNATGSLNFSHYYGERGARTLGLETAQGLPSDTLMFSFLRGASKQYGRLTTQATSIWNRYGYNMYNDRRTMGANGYGLGPNKGCSLSLHKRLFFQSYTGGDSIVGSETSQFAADRAADSTPELSPLGAQHIAIKEWVGQHPERGVLHTPVAFMLDFYHGWNPPRHLYRSDKYRIWGKLPYEKGDYLIDNVFRMVWPGYEDCSYLRNERGFICDTPFGDVFDVISNRCHEDILQQYTTIMLLGEVEMAPELVAKLAAFVEQGGDLILDARHTRALPNDLTGVTVGEEASAVMTRVLATGETFDELPYAYVQLSMDGASPLVINEAGDAIVAVHAAGSGRVIVGAADYWMTDALTYARPEIVNMEPPYRLLHGVEAVLEGYYASHNPVRITPAGLNVRTNVFADDPKRLLIGLTNNHLFSDWEGELEVMVGEVHSAREIVRDQPLPAGSRLSLSIPAGDVAIVDVQMR